MKWLTSLNKYLAVILSVCLIITSLPANSLSQSFLAPPVSCGVDDILLDTDINKLIAPKKVSELKKILKAMIGKLTYQENPAAFNCLLKAEEALEENNKNAILYITEALYEIDNKHVENILIKLLHDNNWLVRKTAAIELGNFGEEHIVDHLLKSMSDEYYLVSRAAIKSLFKIKGKQFVEHLIKKLDDDNENIRDDVIVSLGEFGDKSAVDPLITLLNKYVTILSTHYRNYALDKSNLYTTECIVRALGEIGDMRAVDLISSVLKSPLALGTNGPWLNALSKIDTNKFTSSLIDVLITDGNSSAISMELIKLSKLSLGDELESLVKGMSHSSQIVRKYTAEVLGEFRDKLAVEPLIKALGDEDEDVIEAAANALGKIGDKRAVEPLMEISKNPRFTRFILPLIDLLCEIGDKKAVNQFTFSMFSRYVVNEKTINAATKALIKTNGKKETEKLLISALDNNDLNVRSNAAQALRIIDCKKAVVPLIKALEDNESRVREAAAEALGTIGDNKAVELLIKALGDEDEDVIEAAANALGKIGDKRAVEPLINKISIDGRHVNEYAIKALGKLNDERAIKPLIRIVLYYRDEHIVLPPKPVRTIRHKIPAAEALFEIVDKNTFEDKNTVKQLLEALHQGDERVRWPIARILFKFGNKRIVSTKLMCSIFKEQLQFSNQPHYTFNEEMEAIKSLFKKNRKRALNLLIEMLVIDDYSYNAAKVLDLIGDQEGCFWSDLYNTNIINIIRLGGKYFASLVKALMISREVEIFAKTAFKIIAKSHKLDLLVDELKALKALDISPEMNKAAESLLKMIPVKISNTMIKETVSANPPLRVYYYLQQNYKNCFKEHAHIRRLLDAVDESLALHAEDEHDKLIEQFSDAITAYIDAYSGTVDIAKEYSKISSFMHIVHDNIPHCLNNLVKLDMRIENIDSLVKAMPINNPLTRIIRMLGEEKEMIDGHWDVVSFIKEKGMLPKLYSIIVDIASEKERGAPQEISGILDILQLYQKNNTLADWNEGNWNEFQDNITSYYNAGFKVITLTLFEYYTKHRGDKVKIKELSDSIREEFMKTVWGSFFGLSETLKEKYGLTTEDEIALLAKYLQISSFTGKDYAGAYNTVKAELKEITPKKWQGKVPAELRTLYGAKGSKSEIEYQPDKKADRDELTDLIKRIASYAGNADKPLEMILQSDPFLPEDSEYIKKIRTALVDFILPADKKEYYRTAPIGSSDERMWLSKWYTLLKDTLKNDRKSDIEKIIKQVLEDAGTQNKVSDEKGISLSESRMVRKADNEAVKYVREGKELAEYFIKKWFPLLQYKEIENEALFREWAGSISGVYARKLSNKSGIDVKENTVMEALLAARENYVKDHAKIARISEKQDAQAVITKILNIFNEEIRLIQKQHAFYKDVEIESTDDYFVGYFDDLLHLTGEFIQSGVCTWNDRARAIREGEKEGFHFGTIALKDPFGRVLGFSQVQLLKTPVNGIEDTGSEYKTICLTGINLLKRELDISREKAVKVILQAAVELSKKAGMQRPVIVFDENIHSNQPDVHRIIQDLAEKEQLKKGKLLKEMRLSKDPLYKYQVVYIIQDGLGVELTESTQEIAWEQSERNERLLEKKHLSFSDHFGSIIHNGELSENDAIILKNTVEEIINSMPEEIVGDVRLNFERLDLAFNIIREPTYEKSKVNRTGNSITLYLGNDIIYGKGKIETLGLRDLTAEGIASLLLPDYEKLKNAESHNENAYAKLAVLKMLLNYKAYIPFFYRTMMGINWNPNTYWDEKSNDEKKKIIEECSQNLDKFTRKWKKIGQFIMFVSVLCDVDKDFLVHNYAHILQYLNADITDSDISTIIYEISNTEVLNRVNIAHLRNVFKEFIFDGKVQVKIVDKIQDKNKFDNFDDTEHMQEIYDKIINSIEADEFYGGIRELMAYILPLDEEQVSGEVARLIDKNTIEIDKENRAEMIRDVIKELLTRRIGKGAYEEIEKYLTGRGGSDIEMPESIDESETAEQMEEEIEPRAVIEMLPQELYEGDDADNYDNERSGTDHVKDIFRMQKEEGGSSDDRYRGITLVSYVPVLAVEALALFGYGLGKTDSVGWLSNFISTLPIKFWAVVGIFVVAGLFYGLFHAVWRIFFPTSWFISQLKSENPNTRAAAANKISKSGGKMTAETLILKLFDSNSIVRQNVAKTLGLLGDKSAIEPLINCLSISDINLFNNAVEALKILKASNFQLFDGYFNALMSPHNDVNTKAVNALINFKDFPVIDTLFRYLRSNKIEDQKVYVSATKILKSTDDQMYNWYIISLNNKISEIKLAAIDALTKFNNDRSIDSLLEKLNDPSLKVHISAAKALNNLHTTKDKLVKGYINALKNPNWDIRISAIKALVDLKDKQAIDPIIDLLYDKSPYSIYVKRVAIWALGNLGGTKAVIHLTQILYSSDYIDELCEALAKLNDSRAIDPLIKELPGKIKTISKTLNKLATPKEKLLPRYVEILKGDYWVETKFEAAKNLAALFHPNTIELLEELIFFISSKIRIIESKSELISQEIQWVETGHQKAVVYTIENPEFATLRNKINKYYSYIVELQNEIIKFKRSLFINDTRTNLPIVRDVIKSGKIDIEQIKDSRLVRFFKLLKDTNLNDILIVGGTVRDILLNRRVTDIDISVKCELTRDEQVSFSNPKNEVSNRVFKYGMTQLKNLSKYINYDLKEFIVVQKKGNALFEGLSIEYAGPVEATSLSGKRVLLKQLIFDSKSGNVFISSEGPDLLQLGLDCNGRIYGNLNSLFDLLEGKIRISSYSDSSLNIGGILRLLRIKYEFGLTITEETYNLLQSVLQLYKNNTLTIPIVYIPSIEQQLNRIFETANDLNKAKDDLEKLGIFSIIEKSKIFLDSNHYIPRNSLKNFKTSINIYESN